MTGTTLRAVLSSVVAVSIRGRHRRLPRAAADRQHAGFLRRLYELGARSRIAAPVRHSLSILAFAFAFAAPAGALADASVGVVMSGLENPRGLAFGPEGGLYVAEAGRGDLGEGDGPCATPAIAEICYGATGAVSRLWRGEQERVATGLPSYATASGRAEGPNDIAMLGIGSAHVTIGLEASPVLRDRLSADRAEWAGFGRLVHVRASGRWRFVADIAGYEAAVDPDPRILDSNPYGLLAEPGGQLLTDAGGNSLLRVDANGDISTLAVLPPVSPAGTGDSVPTSVVRGPDEAYYVGELTGAPFADGAAHVYRIVAGEAPEPILTGLRRSSISRSTPPATCTCSSTPPDRRC